MRLFKDHELFSLKFAFSLYSKLTLVEEDFSALKREACFIFQYSQLN